MSHRDVTNAWKIIKIILVTYPQFNEPLLEHKTRSGEASPSISYRRSGRHVIPFDFDSSWTNNKRNWAVLQTLSFSPFQNEWIFRHSAYLHISPAIQSNPISLHARAFSHFWFIDKSERRGFAPKVVYNCPASLHLASIARRSSESVYMCVRKFGVEYHGKIPLRLERWLLHSEIVGQDDGIPLQNQFIVKKNGAAELMRKTAE